MELKTLIDRCRAGDPIAQRKFFDALKERVFSICRLYLNDKRDVQEAVANTFVNVFRSLDAFVYQNDARVMAWIRKIARNCCLEFLRPIKRGTLTLITPTDEIADDNNPLKEMIESETHEQLYIIITQLPDNLRPVFILFHIDGFAHTKIAELLNINEGTSRVRLNRAIEWLRKEITEKYRDYFFPGTGTSGLF